jgi:ferredoxin
MRLHLDRAACEGHGRCYALAPELFDCDEDGHAVLLATGELAADDLDDARNAADNCPEFAITVD